MTLWIVYYHHRHGHDIMPMIQEERPTNDEIMSKLDDFEPERNEWFEIAGPWDLKISIGATE